MNSFREKQYNFFHDIEQETGRTMFGLMVNQSWQQDPRRFLFTLSRYKFVSKMFEGLENVLEIGCADAFGTRLVQQTVKQVTATDFDPLFIEDVRSRANSSWPMEVFGHDILSGPTKLKYQGVFCLDVLEHINKTQEFIFMSNIKESLTEDGIFITGMPSLESQVYASPPSLEGHVNCKSAGELKKTMQNFFTNVFIFSMNDEVLHTGFAPMSQYIFALCCKKK